MLSERFKGQILNILIVDQHLSTLRIINSEKKVKHGCLTEAGRTNDGIGCSSFYLEVEVFKEISNVTLCSVFSILTQGRCLVAKANVLELYQAL